jgi:hypothetical protein
VSRHTPKADIPFAHREIAGTARVALGPQSDCEPQWIRSPIQGWGCPPSEHPPCLYASLAGPVQDGYRNQGGFHMIGSGRDKIETKEELEAGGCRLLWGSLQLAVSRFRGVEE